MRVRTLFFLCFAGEWIYLAWASKETLPNAQQQQQQGAGKAEDAWVELHTNSDFSSFVEWVGLRQGLMMACLVLLVLLVLFMLLTLVIVAVVVLGVLFFAVAC